MKIDGTYTFDFPRDKVWSLLHDSAALQRSIPGCNYFHLLADGKYHISLTMPSGPFMGQYEGFVTPLQDQPQESVQLSITGSGPELVLFGDGVVTLKGANGQTVLIYEGDVEVSGQVPEQSPRLTKTTANFLMRSLLEGLDRQMQLSTGTFADNELSAADSAVKERSTATVDMQDFLAELRRDRTVALTVLILASLGLLSVLGVVFVVVLAARWLKRSLSSH